MSWLSPDRDSEKPISIPSQHLSAVFSSVRPRRQVHFRQETCAWCCRRFPLLHPSTVPVRCMPPLYLPYTSSPWEMLVRSLLCRRGGTRFDTAQSRVGRFYISTKKLREGEVGKLLMQGTPNALFVLLLDRMLLGHQPLSCSRSVASCARRALSRLLRTNSHAASPKKSKSKLVLDASTAQRTHCSTTSSPLHCLTTLQVAPLPLYFASHSASPLLVRPTLRLR